METVSSTPRQRGFSDLLMLSTRSVGMSLARRFNAGESINLTLIVA